MLLTIFLFDVAIFLSSLESGPSFMSLSLLVLELRQSSFVRDLTRNPVIEMTAAWILSNIWELAKISSTEFGMGVSDQ